MDRVLPHSLEAEAYWISTLLDPFFSIKDKDPLFELVPVEDLRDTINAEIAEEAAKVLAEGKNPSGILVADGLKRSGKWTERHDCRISEVSKEVTDEDTAKAQAVVIRDCAARRRLIGAAHGILESAYDHSVPMHDLSDRMGLAASQAEVDADAAAGDRKDKAELIRPATRTEAMVKYTVEGPKNPGVLPGWDKLGELYRPAIGTLNVISGIPSHGKSEFMDAMAVNIARDHGWRFCFFSPENHPVEIHLQKLLEKIVGKPVFDMTEEEIRGAMEWLEKHFRFVRLAEDSHTLEALLRLIDKPIKAGEFNALVIDPWNELDLKTLGGDRETDYIGKALSRLRRYGRRNNIAIFILAHPAKMYKDKDALYYNVPTLYDLAGCHDEITEVLTDSGWIKHGEVGLNHHVCCFDLSNEKLSYQKPSKLWKYRIDDTLVKISGRSYEALITKNHKLVVKANWKTTPNFMKRYRGSGLGRPERFASEWTKIEAQNITSGMIAPWACGFEKDNDEHGISDEWLMFIGWWIAEGCESGGSLAICQAIGSVQKKMKKCLDKIGFPYSDKITHYVPEEKPMWVARIKIRGNKEAKYFAKYVLSECGIGCENKRLPSVTWKLSKRQKTILMAAYLEGDGCKRRGLAMCACTTSKTLADDLQRLSIEIGRMATVSVAAWAKPGYKTRYQISIGTPLRKTIALRKERNFSTEKYCGNVYCLTVPTGAYLTRRNGKVFISGNSAHWYNKADNGLTIYRNFDNNTIDVHVQKIKYKIHGAMGLCTMVYQKQSGRFLEQHESEMWQDKH